MAATAATTPVSSKARRSPLRGTRRSTRYNGNTSFGNATANNNINYLALDGFNYYNDTPELVQNTSFGSYEKVSDDPLTVKYTIADGVNWSDGTPVDAADLLLHWAALSRALDTPGLRPGRVHRPRHR